MTRDEAATIIRQSDLSPHAEVLIENLLPSIRITATKVSLDELPIGASRMGGLPDLPEDFVWPRWTGTQLQWSVARRVQLPERDLDFIAQVDLKELNAFSACRDLPAEGTLYFFYDSANQVWGFDPEDHLGSRVIYVKPGQQLARRAYPSADETGWYPCKLSFSQAWTLPDWESLGWDPTGPLDDLEEVREQIGDPQPEYFAPIHRLLGWPEPVQGDMRLQCQLVANGIYCGDTYDDPKIDALQGGAKVWLLLLQVDSDEVNPGWMWGDMGRIYYWIHKDDLATRRFENVRLILQCS